MKSRADGPRIRPRRDHCAGNPGQPVPMQPAGGWPGFLHQSAFAGHSAERGLGENPEVPAVRWTRFDLKAGDPLQIRCAACKPVAADISEPQRQGLHRHELGPASPGWWTEVCFVLNLPLVMGFTHPSASHERRVHRCTTHSPVQFSIQVTDFAGVRRNTQGIPLDPSIACAFDMDMRRIIGGEHHLNLAGQAVWNR